MANPARADVERDSLPEFAADLRRYTARAQDVLTSAEHMGSAALARAADQINRARVHLADALEAQEAARRTAVAQSGLDGPGGGGLGYDVTAYTARVARAHDRLEASYAVRQRLEEITAEFRPASRRFATSVDALSDIAQKTIAQAGRDLDAYLGHGPGSSSRSPVPEADATRVGAPPKSWHEPGLPEDIVMVPLGSIDDSDSPLPGAAQFSQFYTAADLEWAHDAFRRVILPGLGRSESISDFKNRDDREGRMGVRSYSMTYHGFLGTDAIVLSPSGTSFEIANGYHRVWVARHMGLDAIPARIAGTWKPS